MNVWKWIVRLFRSFHPREVDWGAIGAALAVVLMLLVVILAVVRLHLSARIVVEARRLQEMRDELDDLRRSNRTLEIEIARQTYGLELARRARELGLGTAEEIVFLEP